MVGPGSKERFEEDDKDFYDPEKPNEKKAIGEAFKGFMEDSDANVLLLSGAAGSGKVRGFITSGRVALENVHPRATPAGNPSSSCINSHSAATRPVHQLVIGCHPCITSTHRLPLEPSTSSQPVCTRPGHELATGSHSISRHSLHLPPDHSRPPTTSS